MKFLTVLNAVLLAAAGVIALVLGVVCILFAFNLGEDIAVASLPGVLRHTAIFLALALVSATAFLSLLKRHPIWPLPQALMWIGIGLTAWHYVPA